MDYSMVADPSNPLMDEANMPAIIRTFPSRPTRRNGDPVIDVTALFTTRRAGVRGAAARVGGRGMDRDPHVPREGRRRIRMNINVEVTAT